MIPINIQHSRCIGYITLFTTNLKILHNFSHIFDSKKWYSSVFIYYNELDVQTVDQ